MDLRISTLLNAYRNGTTTPRTVIENILKEMDKAPSQIWISRLSRESLEKYLEPLENCKTIFVRCAPPQGQALAVYNRLLRASDFHVIDTEVEK